MNSIRLLAILCFIVGSLRAGGHEQALDLVGTMEKAVGLAARGDIGSALRELNAEAKNPKSMKEVGAQTDKFKEAYGQVSQLGELDEVERISLVYSGESFFRLRLAEKRADGAIVWTLIGYKFKGLWYCKGISFNGGDDLMALMHQELDPADAQPPIK